FLRNRQAPQRSSVGRAIHYLLPRLSLFTCLLCPRLLRFWFLRFQCGLRFPLVIQRRVIRVSAFHFFRICYSIIRVCCRCFSLIRHLPFLALSTETLLPILFRSIQQLAHLGSFVA